MGEALRSLPQNFGGGQNPGVGIGAIGGGLTNRNVTGGSAVTLRGPGPDATLTVLNGHRISFGGLVPGVDISTIPHDVVERRSDERSLENEGVRTGRSRWAQ